MKYRIYRNLHSKTWTVQHKVPGKGWRKLKSVESLYAPSCSFTVGEAGRTRARSEGRKNVHAFAIVDEYFEDGNDNWVGKLIAQLDNVITYSPFNSYGFTTRNIPTSRATDNIQAARVVAFAPSGRIYAHEVDGYEQLTLEEELGVMRITVPTS